MPTSKKNTPKPFIIDDDTSNDLIFGPAPDGIPRAHGLVPRDYAIYPKEMYKPADIETCTNQADKLDCTGQEGKVCEGAPGGEVCACALDDEMMPIWDCDKAPTTWAM